MVIIVYGQQELASLRKLWKTNRNLQCKFILSWLGVFLQSKRSPAGFPVWEHAWGVGLVLVGERMRQLIDVSLSH